MPGWRIRQNILMDLGSILLILAVFILVAMFVSQPFSNSELTRTDEDSGASLDSLQSSLLAEHERILSTLQELEFDNNLGKIPAEDYAGQRSALVLAGAEVLRKLDSTPVSALISQASELPVEDVHEEHRSISAQPAAFIENQEDIQIEEAIARRRKERTDKAAGFCPKCGKPLQKSDLFCPRCGTKI
jgi:hypothetical protein